MNKKLPNIILLGAPGSGKGTVAAKLVEELGYLHYSTGQMFREFSSGESELSIKIKNLMSSGKLIDDDTTNEMIATYIKKALDTHQPFILDGYPRTTNQAKFLAKICDIDLVICINIDQDDLIKRITGRVFCPNCDMIYNTFFKKPLHEGFCDKCNTPLVSRKDDNKETIITRLKVYNELTKPLITFYEAKNKLVNVFTDNKSNHVFEDIKKLIEK